MIRMVNDEKFSSCFVINLIFYYFRVLHQVLFHPWDSQAIVFHLDNQQGMFHLLANQVTVLHRQDNQAMGPHNQDMDHLLVKHYYMYKCSSNVV